MNNEINIQTINNLNESIISSLTDQPDTPTINMACDLEACYVMTSEFELVAFETED